MVLTFLSKAPCRARALGRAEGGRREGRNLCIFSWPTALAWGSSLYKEGEDTTWGWRFVGHHRVRKLNWQGHRLGSAFRNLPNRSLGNVSPHLTQGPTWTCTV